MKVWIRGKKNPWIFKWQPSEVIENRFNKNGVRAQILGGYYYKTKNNIYKIETTEIGLAINRLHYQNDEWFWYPNPWSKYIVEKVEFLYGIYTRNNR